jgi:hypothetical protein
MITFTTDSLPVIFHHLLNCPCFYIFYSFHYTTMITPQKLGAQIWHFSCSAACIDWQSTTQRGVMLQTKRDKTCRVWPWLIANILLGFKSLINFTWVWCLDWSGLMSCRVHASFGQEGFMRWYGRMPALRCLHPPPPQKKIKVKWFHYCHVYNLLL